MAKIVNLTPHAITIVGPSGPTMTIPPSGVVARVATTPSPAGEVAAVEGVVALHRVAFGEVQGLPGEEAETIFVVSALVRAAVPHRGDVASPGDLVRGEDGQPIGCRGLIIN